MATDDTLVTQLSRELDEICPLVRRQAADADRRLVLSDEVAQWLVDHRLFRLWIPRRYDGLELSLPDTLEVYQAAARVDGSLGWAVMIGCGGGLFAAYLPEDSAREIYGPAPALIAGSGAPEGRAERVAGGYRARGRWRYASGAPYATTFTANCIVTSGGEPVLDESGAPLIRAMAFEPADVEIVETWDASGMRGTASHDISVREAFVPERRTFSVFTDAPRETGTLYRLPFQVLTELPVTSVALGIARHALDAFAELAAVKKPYGAATPLAEDTLARVAFARAHGAWRMARSAVTALAERAWQAAEAARTLAAEERAEITATCAHAVEELNRATQELVGLAGMTGTAWGAELGRAGRDLATLTAHASIATRQLPGAGGALLAAASRPAW